MGKSIHAETLQMVRLRIAGSDRTVLVGPILDHIKDCKTCLNIVAKIWVTNKLIEEASLCSVLGHPSEFDLVRYLSTEECEKVSVDTEEIRLHVEQGHCVKCQNSINALKNKIQKLVEKFMEDPERSLLD